MKIVIIDYGAGNIQSVQFAIERLGYTAILSSDPNEIITADKVIFPGVGQAESALKKLQEQELDVLIPTLKQPVLGICLGMQLLCASTEEGNVKGLGVFDLAVKRFDQHLKVPQIGWNQIQDLKSSLFTGVATDSFVYLVHSYFVPQSEHTICSSNYGGLYSTGIQRDNFYGVQFHPEKSSSVGAKILANFLAL